MSEEGLEEGLREMTHDVGISTMGMTDRVFQATLPFILPWRRSRRGVRQTEVGVVSCKLENSRRLWTS